MRKKSSIEIRLPSTDSAAASVAASEAPPLLVGVGASGQLEMRQRQIVALELRAGEILGERLDAHHAVAEHPALTWLTDEDRTIGA